jgi:hypothetical protein
VRDGTLRRSGAKRGHWQRHRQCHKLQHYCRYLTDPKLTAEDGLFHIEWAPSEPWFIDALSNLLIKKFVPDAVTRTSNDRDCEVHRRLEPYHPLQHHPNRGFHRRCQLAYKKFWPYYPANSPSCTSVSHTAVLEARLRQLLMVRPYKKNRVQLVGFGTFTLAE